MILPPLESDTISKILKFLRKFKRGLPPDIDIDSQKSRYHYAIKIKSLKLRSSGRELNANFDAG